MTEAPEIGCVVLNWNGGKRILDCLGSLTASQGVRTSIVVVDNGSTDDSIVRIQRTYPAIHIHECGENVGLAKARNIGVKFLLERKHRVILFIDDDATVEESSLAKLSAALNSDTRIGIVSPRILDGKNQNIIWYDGGKVNVFGDTVHRNANKALSSVKANESLPIEFATGCCVLIKSEVFESLGFLDESFCVYSEDADFSLRARSGGYSILHMPTAVARHLQSGDTKGNRGKWFRDYYVTRNKFLLFSKHYSGLRKLVASTYFLLECGMRIVFFAVSGQLRRSGAIIEGISDFFAKRFGMRYA